MEQTLFRYDARIDSFVAVKPQAQRFQSFVASNVIGITENSDGRLWLSTSSGIYVYNPKTNNIEENHFPDQFGTPHKIVFDDYGNAWVTTGTKIWCFIKNKKEWFSFSPVDGLPAPWFENDLVKRPNGDIVAGVLGGVAIFHPKFLFERKKSTNIYITEATAGDSTYYLLSGKNKSLKINSDAKSFSVDFAIMDFRYEPAKKYFYKLAPLMKEFQQSKDGHIVFTGLPHGEYQLSVKGADKTGDFYTNLDNLTIIIKPRWYQTWWFKVLAGLLIAGLVSIAFRYRIQNIKKHAFLQQKIVQTEMDALRAQMNPHFIFNSLNSIENFILKNEKRLASDYLNKFARLIRVILDSSRNELVPFQKDIEAINLYIDLERLRFNNRFDYISQIDPKLIDGNYFVPPLLIQPFVENAILHGIGNSDKKELFLIISATVEHSSIKYSITDNGIGREKAEEYKRQNRTHHKSVGAEISMERIKRHNEEKNSNDKIEIIDLYDENKRPSGTRVEVIIKAN